jgi:hypothetical protein
MSSVRETDSRQDALRERLRDPVYARAYRAYATSLAQRARATIGRRAAGGFGKSPPVTAATRSS